MSDLLKEFGLEPPQDQQRAVVQPEAAPAASPAPALGPDLNAAVAGNRAILQQVGNVAKDIGVGITEIPTAVAHGSIKAVNEVSNTAFELAQVADRYAPLGQIEIDRNGVRWKPGMPKKNDAQVPNVVPEPTTVTGGLVDGVSQFVTGYVLGGKALKAFGIPATGLTGVAAKTAFSGAAAFDPTEARLSNLINDHTPFGNAVTEYLAASPDDSRAEGRFKNAIEQVALNVPLEAVFSAVKGLKAKRAGDLKAAEEAANAADEALQTWREAGAKAAGERLDNGGTGKAPPSLDTASLEASQQTGLHGAPGMVEVPQALKAADVNTPKPVSDYVAKPGYTPPTFDTQNLLDTFALASGNGANSIDTFAGSIVGKNMARVNNENDAKVFFNTLGTTEAEAFAKAKGRSRTLAEIEQVANDSIEKLADYTGTDVGDLRVRMASDVKNLNELADRVAGYRMGVELYSKRSAELARSIIKGDASEFGGDIKALHAEFLSAAQTLLSIAPLTEGVKSGLGRNLSLLRANVGPGEKAVGKLAGVADNAKPNAASEANAALAGDLAKALEGGDAFVQRLAQKLALADNPKVAKKVVDDAFGPGLMDVHNEFWINSILSGPKTHVINLTTSGIKSALVMPTEQMVAGILSRDLPTFMMGADHYAGMFFSMKDALRLAGRALKEGDPVLDPTHMGLSNSRHAIVPETFGLNTDTPQGMLVSGFGSLVRLPGRLLTTEDEFLKQLNYRARLYSEAMREARAMRNQHGVTDEEIGKFVSEYMERGFDANGRGTNDGAMAYARDATFTNDLAVATNSGGKSIGESINEMANNHPGLRIALPFTRVPTNILRDAWDHTPGLNMLRKQFREELRAGGERGAIAKAKIATGGAMWTAAVMMAANGDITGSLSSDPKIRRMEEEAGKKANSLRFFDEDGKPYYIEYGRLDPYATFFSIAATVAETAGHANDWQLEDMAGSLVVGLAKNLESKTYLQGLTNVLAAMADPDRRGADFVRRQMASYVPSITNTFKGADYLSDPRTVAEAMLARTPGNAGVDPRYNLLGEKVKVPAAFGPDWLSPFALSDSGRQDAVLGELARLAQVHKGGMNYPAKKQGSDIQLDQINLGDKTAYARFQELTGEVRVSGLTLRERLAALFNSEDYKKKLTDGEPNFDGSRMYQVGATLQAYREAAKIALAKESPQFMQAWQADERKKYDTIRFGAQPK